MGINEGCKRCLHRENYDFGRKVESSESLQALQDRKPPSQYPFVGFKDRNLEDEYLEDLVRTSKSRIILGLAVTTLLFLFGPVSEVAITLPSWSMYDSGPYNKLVFILVM